MTIAQLLRGVVYAGTVAAALTALGVFFHYVLVRPLRGVLRNEIVGHLVEIREGLTRHTQNLQALEQRLEEHIITGHEGDRHAMVQNGAGRDAL